MTREPSRCAGTPPARSRRPCRPGAQEGGALLAHRKEAFEAQFLVRHLLLSEPITLDPAPGVIAVFAGIRIATTAPQAGAVAGRWRRPSAAVPAGEPIRRDGPAFA
jgi:hypothetical protein